MKSLASSPCLLLALSTSVLPFARPDDKPPAPPEQFAEVVLTVEGMT